MRKSFKNIVRLFIKVILCCFLLMMFFVFLYKWLDPPFTFLMFYREQEAKKSGKTLIISHKKIPLDQLPIHTIYSIVYAEDPQFFNHRGLILSNLLLAKKNYFDKKRKKLRGYSTISQQTAKNIFLYPHRTLTRKLLELPFVLLMEILLTKERILELYVNNIEWGNGIFGIESACQTYFGKSAKFLNPTESAILAVMLYNPRSINPLELGTSDYKRAWWIHEMSQRKVRYLKFLEKKKNEK